MLRFATRRLIGGILVLAAITLLSFVAQDCAQLRQPMDVGRSLLQGARQSAHLWVDLARGDLSSYITSPVPGFGSRTALLRDILGALLANSLALLVLALLLGGVVGGLAGSLAAGLRRPGASLAVLLASVVGVSTPSFFLGLLLQILEIGIYRATGLRLVPVGGFGWDSHLVLPVLVLAGRPIAQVARLTYVRAAAILEEDYVHTAVAKGLTRRKVWWVHIAPNLAASVLTAMGTSLRLALSSLPVVEFLFGWPGAGRALLDMLRAGQREAATVVFLTMGAAFVGVNLALDLAYRAWDPRQRDVEAELRPPSSWTDYALGVARSFGSGLWALVTLRALRTALADSRRARTRHPRAAELSHGFPRATSVEAGARRRAWRQATWGNPALLVGVAIGVALFALMVGGPALAPRDPNVSSPHLLIDGVRVYPPVSPGALFPLGTDGQGRDILSLLLAGARRTLTIALLAVVARLMVGGALGFLAGWFNGSRLDRAIMALAEVVGAFPALLLAMLLVYAIGIRQGMVAFVAALAAIGWGEVMQTVRSQVLAIRPMAYIEGAVAAGVHEGRILRA